MKYKVKSRKLTGVYVVQNNVNSKIYVGASKNIYKRFNAHKHRYNDKNNKEYHKPLYVDMRLYGIDSFSFSVYDICDESKIYDIERATIRKLHSDNPEFGYNVNVSINHHNKKHAITDIKDIRTHYANHERKCQVYEMYKTRMKKCCFNKIWKGETWKEIMPDVYTDENKNFHKHNTANRCDNNGRAKISNDDVISIRENKIDGIEPRDVYIKYADKLAYRSFMNIWYNSNWKSIE